MIKRFFRKLIETVFTVNFIGFVIFMYLFSTRVTSDDIEYFIKYTQENKTALFASIDNYREEQALKKEKAAEVKEQKPSKEKTKGNESKNESDSANGKDIVLKSDTINLTYYSQVDDRWSNEIYGANNTIGVYGCGPTALAMILTTLKGETYTPTDAAKWAYDNGHFSNNSGSYHSIIPKGAEKHGLNQKSLTKPSKETIIEELKKGGLIAVLMEKGTFTSEGHFLILRGVTKDSQILIADPMSLDNSKKSWDVNVILDEAKYSASYGGPFWLITK